MSDAKESERQAEHVTSPSCFEEKGSRKLEPGDSRVWRWLEVWRRGRNPCPKAAVTHMACSKHLLTLPPPLLSHFLTPPIHFSSVSPCPVCSHPHAVSLFNSSLSPFFPLVSFIFSPSLFSVLLRTPLPILGPCPALPCPPSCLCSLSACLSPASSFFSWLFCFQLCGLCSPRSRLCLTFSLFFWRILQGALSVRSLANECRPL